jgi:hypothetical protein
VVERKSGESVSVAGREAVSWELDSRLVRRFASELDGPNNEPAWRSLEGASRPVRGICRQLTNQPTSQPTI